MCGSSTQNEIINIQPIKRVLIETWGCQMNIADSERILGLLGLHGYKATNTLEEADLIVLNTCHIRAKAKHKVLSRLGHFRDHKMNKPDLIVAVTGCIPQMEAAELIKSSPIIDIAMGPGRLNDLPLLINEFRTTQKPIIAIGFNGQDHHHDSSEHRHEENMDALIPIELLSGKNPISRFINIIQGCENFCTYCVVPYTRGKERSRPEKEILDEIESLLDGGAKEITLLGQNVNSYMLDRGGDIVTPEATTPFIHLIEKIVKNERIDSLRFTTSNPYNFSRPLADLFGRYPKLGKYIHLPVQSGSNHILKRMNRKISREAYLEKISWLREKYSDMAISTDLIVGFPGETAEDFAQTLQLVEEVRFSSSFSFKYSPRPGTPAAQFEDQVPEKIKEQRLDQLQKLQDKITAEQNIALIGKELDVQCHYPNSKQENSYYGRSDCFRLVKVASPRNILGKKVRVIIRSANRTALEGELILA